MPKIAICDDEQPIREYLKSLTEKCIPDSQVRLFERHCYEIRHPLM